MTAAQRILVLGGTSWLGGAVARVAVDRGHEVTCLARGQSGGAPDGVRWVRADRWQPGAYDDVADVAWDTVVDVSRQPEQVRSALSDLAERTRHWIYVSSCSVYRDDSVPDGDESAALHEPWSGTGTASDEEYAQAKVSCETACRGAVPEDRLLVARAGLIGGYGDLSDRLGYWTARMARAVPPRETVLVPPTDAPVQVVDVEDLSAWLVACAEVGTSGTYNVTGDVVSLGDLLRLSADVTGRHPTYAEADQEFLEEQKVQPWSGDDSLPLWLPMPQYAGFMSRRNDAAKAVGLRLRPLRETLAAALAWETELGLDRDRRAGLAPTRESEVLAALSIR
jgi:2'-hydroxyisoflavone reductase